MLRPAVDVDRMVEEQEKKHQPLAHLEERRRSTYRRYPENMWTERHGPSDHGRTNPTAIGHERRAEVNERKRVVLLSGIIPRTAHGRWVVYVNGEAMEWKNDACLTGRWGNRFPRCLTDERFTGAGVAYGVGSSDGSSDGHGLTLMFVGWCDKYGRARALLNLRVMTFMICAGYKGYRGLSRVMGVYNIKTRKTPKSI